MEPLGQPRIAEEVPMQLDEVGEPDLLVSPFINAIKQVPADWTPVGQ